MDRKIKMLCGNLSDEAEKFRNIREMLSETWCSDAAQKISDDTERVRSELLKIVDGLENTGRIE